MSVCPSASPEERERLYREELGPRANNSQRPSQQANEASTPRVPSKIRLLKVQSGSPFPQIIIWRCPQLNRQPSRTGWLEKPDLGKAGSVNAILLDFLLGNSP